MSQYYNVLVYLIVNSFKFKRLFIWNKESEHKEHMKNKSNSFKINVSESTVLTLVNLDRFRTMHNPSISFFWKNINFKTSYHIN